MYMGKGKAVETLSSNSCLWPVAPLPPTSGPLLPGQPITHAFRGCCVLLARGGGIETVA